MKTFFKSLPAILLALVLVSPFPAQAAAQLQAGSLHREPAQDLPVVRAVMFWMRGCPHCHDVLDNVLPPLQEKYGDQLEIKLIEVASSEAVDQLVQSANTFGIPKEQVVVPFLIIGNRALIGSVQIPAELPGLIAEHLAAGGIDFPEVPGLMIEPTAITETVETAAQTVENQPPTEMEPSKPATDGFTLAIGIMTGMLAALVITGMVLVRGFQGYSQMIRPAWQELAIPILSVVGLSIAGYLAYVETQAVPAACGPVGDCNAVQSSPYAKLFGFLPVGVLGAAGYLLILAAWLWKRLRSGRSGQYASLAIFGMAFFGTLFSLYLTYLEPFVIRAVCMWCLSSAVIITLLLLLSVRPALQIWETNEQ